MRLALLGADADTQSIVAGIAERRDQLVGVCEFAPGDAAQTLSDVDLPAPEIAAWEELLDTEFVDAVIVAHSLDEERRAEQLRKFVQADIPVLVAHPLPMSMLVYYELDMMRRESQAVILPYLHARLHPGFAEFGRLLANPAAGGIGPIEQVVFERHLIDRGREEVTAHFARDVDLLRTLGGEISRLHAMGPAPDSASYGNLNVQVVSNSGMTARWSVVPAADRNWGRLTLLGPGGTAALTMPGDATPWRFELSAAGNRLERELDQHWQAGRVALDRLQLAIQGTAVTPDWFDAARSAELTETIGRSLKKGRTIELHYEDHSEASTFKGTMTAIGCGVLLLAPVLLAVLGVIENLGKALKWRMPFARQWPYWLVVMLGVFLALQFLLLASRREKAAPARIHEETDSDD